MNKKSKYSLLDEYDDSDDQMSHPCTSLAAQINQYLGNKLIKKQMTADHSGCVIGRRSTNCLFQQQLHCQFHGASSAPVERVFSYSRIRDGFEDTTFEAKAKAR